MAHDETILAVRRQKSRMPMVAALLAGALLGHVIAAHLGGGSRIDYVHHIGGFFFIAAITGLPIAGLTRLFWRRHSNVALLIFGLIQLVLGLLVMIGEWRAH